MAASLVFRLHDKGPKLVREVLLERGWEEYDEEEREDEDWNLYWRGSAFRNAQYHNLLPWQRLNHHPKTAGITRKDCLARNLRRMRATFGSALYDFSPVAFILPNDYTRFLSEYDKLRPSRGPPAYWICKPVDLSRGRGIFLFEDLKDLVYDCPVIVQRYISDPLLISGYKFDLRIYVCVKSFHPLTVYIHQEGLVRFATEKYDLASLRNFYAHLTNTSINKLGPFYRTEKERVGRGCKWTMSKFRHFLHSQDVNQNLLWQRINNIVTLSLLTIAPSVPSCPNCLELFGFDVLVDVRFKPWLLEVNYSPALTLDCPADVAVKKRLIGDLVDLMNYTLVDGLREKAYQRRGCEKSRFHANLPANSSIPVFPKFKKPKFLKQSSGTQPLQTQALPVLKTNHRFEKRQHKQSSVVAYTQRFLPPVDLNKRQATGDRIIAKNQRDKTLNWILGPHSRTNVTTVNRQACPALAARLTDNRSLLKSEVTNCDDTETEAEADGLSAETDVSSSVLDTPQRGHGLRCPAVPWKLPDIHSGRHEQERIHFEENTTHNRQHVPPLRVGDFIRTFPFNTATLRAAQQELDIKVITRELQKLTGRLAKADKKRRTEKEEEKKDEDEEEDFDSLLWGPKDPPLISQCLKRQ
ncbi:probable tubulin polyglutamylase TTLL2 [Labrus bergylta]|uniref:probable tubulin polyglutamylase TTLL2 n=1 Tax=Labrus bergylta TaxID=56723 RepID=UPI003313C500